MGEVAQWQYQTYVMKNPEIATLDRTLSYFGRGGWELVTMTSTIKFWNRALGNDLVLVLKRPTSVPADVAMGAPRLFDDEGQPLKDPWGVGLGTASAPAKQAVDEGYHGA